MFRINNSDIVTHTKCVNVKAKQSFRFRIHVFFKLYFQIINSLNQFEKLCEGYYLLNKHLKHFQSQMTHRMT